MRDATDITIVLDRSGSMADIKADTIGGFNQFVADQARVPGECHLTLIQFDSQDRHELVVDHVPMAEVKRLTEETFTPRGGTPLYDALGLAITATGERLKLVDEANRPSNVVFVIVTDGLENASHQYTREQVFALISTQTNIWKWHFVYLGANQDAMAEGHKMAIQPDYAMTYTASPAEVRVSYDAMSSNMTALRMGQRKDLSWTKEQRDKAKAKAGGQQ